LSIEADLADAFHTRGYRLGELHRDTKYQITAVFADAPRVFWTLTATATAPAHTPDELDKHLYDGMLKELQDWESQRRF
jgi:hypothetical protein